MSNAQTVHDIYAAFGRGDVPAILEKLSGSVRWDADSPMPQVPWLMPRQGRDNTAAFFASLAPLDFMRFEPHTFFESGDKVFVLVAMDVTHKPSGKRYAFANEGHLWEFDGSGKVARFDHVTDTATHLKMSRGE
jgi:ketosteroid isomerase-like protein